MPRAEAASVVTELAAFLREPTRHRPRYTHGREVLEGGHHALRFAQGKFPPGLMHDTPTHRREELRAAADAFIRQVCFWEGATHYQVLCVSPSAPREAIKENYHLLMALIHPDRGDPAAHPWPRDWVQRANQAYAVLCDDAQRAAYDASLRATGAFAAKAACGGGPGGAARPGTPRTAARRRRRLAKALLAVAAVVAVVSTLVLFGGWYGETPREYSLFEGLGRSGQHADRPRYLGLFPSRDAAAAPVVPASAAGEAIAATGHEAPHRRPAPLARSPAPVAATTPARAESPREAEPSTPAERAVEAETLAPVPAREAAPAGATAQAVFVAQALPGVRPTTEQIESVVARLVGCYEAGDADQLMGLLAGDEGYRQRTRMRQSYADFFHATRQRRLHLERLEWRPAALGAHATGEATVQAQFVDESRALQRRVSIELDIAMREGEAKITRLSLYPNAP